MSSPNTVNNYIPQYVQKKKKKKVNTNPVRTRKVKRQRDPVLDGLGRWEKIIHQKKTLVVFEYHRSNRKVLTPIDLIPFNLAILTSVFDYYAFFISMYMTLEYNHKWKGKALFVIANLAMIYLPFGLYGLCYFSYLQTLFYKYPLQRWELVAQQKKIFDALDPSQHRNYFQGKPYQLPQGQTIESILYDPKYNQDDQDKIYQVK